MNASLPAHMNVDQPLISDDDLAEIGLLLETRRNFSIVHYKDKYLKRRIALRMRACRCLETAAYRALLHQSESELDILKKGLTIHVSHFFRNPSLFEKLRTDILPAIFQQKLTSFKIWSLGCAGGEEAYSMALLLHEQFPQQLEESHVEIRAMDIDSDILLSGERAVYQQDRLKEVSPHLQKRYFTPHGAAWQLVPDIRTMVTFHRMSIMNMESLEPCQMVLCRNTLIYFSREEQEKILRSIAQLLSPGGILVLGKSETLTGNIRRHFNTLCPVERIYHRM